MAEDSGPIILCLYGLYLTAVKSLSPLSNKCSNNRTERRDVLETAGLRTQRLICKLHFIHFSFVSEGFSTFSSESYFPCPQVPQWLCFLCHTLWCRNWLASERKNESRRARVPQSLKHIHTWVSTACQHPSRIIRSLRGNKLDDSVYRILGIQERN